MTGQSAPPLGDNATPPSPETITQYRAGLDTLMAKCLQSVRSFDVPAVAEPLQSWSGGD